MVREFESSGDLPHTIACRVEDYCQRVFGRADLPEPMRYPDDIVPLALSDPATWEGNDMGLPGLLEEAEEARDALEERLARWAPVVIAEPELAAVAVNATRLLPVSN